MKPFDLEASKRGEAIRYRAGDTPVRYLGFLNGRDHCIAVAYQEDNSEYVESVGPIDLFMAPKKEKRWIVSWVNPNGAFSACGYTSTEAANSGADWCRHNNCTNIQIHETEVEL